MRDGPQNGGVFHVASIAPYGLYSAPLYASQPALPESGRQKERMLIKIG